MTLLDVLCVCGYVFPNSTSKLSKINETVTNKQTPFQDKLPMYKKNYLDGGDDILEFLLAYTLDDNSEQI